MRERNSSKLDGVDYWKEKADNYWREAEQLRKNNNSLQLEIKELRDKKKVGPKKKRGEWDSMATKKVVHDAGLPTLLGGATWYIIIKAADDMRINSMMGLSFRGFWMDTDISTWVQSGMVLLYAAAIKWMSKYDIK
ncbi:hypothetical protein HN803_03825 [candidate division WWE3 bacterium]|nr:hypothetical protein [candidate division WWE3 bacterium]